MSKYEFEMKEPTGCDKCPFCNKGDDFYDVKTENPTRTYCAFPVQGDNARPVYLNWPYNVVPTHCPLKAAKRDNFPLPINEGMGVHNKWYVEAHLQTLDTIEGFAKHLMGDYIHDYGTVCHAIAASMMGMMHATNDSPYGSITGFQAGEIMWLLIRYMNYPSNVCGLRLIDYDNMLYPQYEDKFTEHKLSKETFEAMQKEAAKKLEIDATRRDHAHPKVIAHWQSIVDGKVPFGYTLKKEPEEEKLETSEPIDPDVLSEKE